MRKIKGYMISVLICGVLMVSALILAIAAEETKATAPESAPVEVNLIKNAGFEEDKDADGSPDVWKRMGSEGLTCLMDAEEKHSGKYSSKITSTRKIYNDGWTQTVDVSPGKEYEFSVWAKGGSDLEYFQGDSGPVAMLTGPVFIEKGKDLKASQTWLKLSKNILGPADGKLKIDLYLYMCGGTVWFDDVLLKPVN